MQTNESLSTDHGTSENDRPSKILLVDDESSNRFLMRDILADSGYEIVEAENGRLALEVAETEAPDTVLLDVMMPEMDGFEACRRLKQQESTRLIPVLMVSALSDRSNQLKGHLRRRGRLYHQADRRERYAPAGRQCGLRQAPVRRGQRELPFLPVAVANCFQPIQHAFECVFHLCYTKLVSTD